MQLIYIINLPVSNTAQEKFKIVNYRFRHQTKQNENKIKKTTTPQQNEAKI